MSNCRWTIIMYNNNTIRINHKVRFHSSFPSSALWSRPSLRKYLTNSFVLSHAFYKKKQNEQFTRWPVTHLVHYYTHHLYMYVYIYKLGNCTNGYNWERHEAYLCFFNMSYIYIHTHTHTCIHVSLPLYTVDCTVARWVRWNESSDRVKRSPSESYSYRYRAFVV